jgi:thiamine kinase-like enzyme
MDTSPSEKANEEFNSYYNFIRPSSNNNGDCVDNKSRSLSRIPPLQISTDPLGISYTTSNRDKDNDTDNDDIFKQLNYPHMKRPLYSPTSESSSTASSPQLKPTTQQVATIPSPKDPIPLSSPTNKMIQLSPAASFLASFMSSPSTKHSHFTSTAYNHIPPSQQQTQQQQQHQQTSDDHEITVIDEYNVGDAIGFGGFSSVRKAQHQKSNEVVAVKIINQHLMNQVDEMRLDRELSIWKSLAHPRIIQLRKVIKSNSTCYLICDYCSEGNLLKYLNKVKKLTEQEAKKIFKEICQGVYYLHVDRKVLHKDLKLENILLDDQGHIKICDFGLAIYQHQHHHFHQNKRNRKTYDHEDDVAGGSLAYASPEQIRQVTPLICPKTDIWSLGVILYALVVGSLPFMDTYYLRLQQKILEGQYSIPATLTQPLQQLIQDCLAYEPEKRISIDQVLNSVWLKNSSNNNE